MEASRRSGIPAWKILGNLETKRQVDWWRGKKRGEWGTQARASLRWKRYRARKKARLAAQAAACQVTQVTDTDDGIC